MDNVQQKDIANSDWISLTDDEEIKYWSHPSLYSYAIKLASGLLIAVASLFAPFLSDFIGLWGLLGIIVGAFVSLVGYIEYLSEFYVFTNQRILHKWGIISHRVKSIGYDDVLKKQPTYPLDGRLLGYGHFRAVTATPDKGDIVMKYIPDMDTALSISTKYDND